MLLELSSDPPGLFSSIDRKKQLQQGEEKPQIMVYGCRRGRRVCAA